VAVISVEIIVVTVNSTSPTNQPLKVQPSLTGLGNVPTASPLTTTRSSTESSSNETVLLATYTADDAIK